MYYIVRYLELFNVVGTLVVQPRYSKQLGLKM